MADKEVKKRKSKTSWWVLTQTDDCFVAHYKGSERKRARGAAEKLLGETKADVFVLKIGSLSVLRNSDLRSVLPKDAF